MEYFFRDVYEAYGYDFQYYNGEDVNQDWVKEKIHNFTRLNSCIAESWKKSLKINRKVIKKIPDGNENTRFRILSLKEENEQDPSDAVFEQMAQEVVEKMNKDRYRFACCLLEGLNFINRRGQPLHMMKALKLDPALLEQPLYH